MDNRITKERLKNFFVYDFFKAFIVCVIVGVLIALLFTSLGKKPTNGQSFYLMIADNVSISDDCKYTGNSMLNKEYEKYNFCYDILEANTLQCQDAGTYSASYLMTMYLSTNQCDIFVGFDDRDLADESSESLINTFINNGCAIEIYATGNDNCFVNRAKKYAQEYLIISGDSITVNESKVKEEFQSKYGKDSRFETDEKYAKGLQDEYSRIKNIYLNAIALENIFINHPELLVKYTFNDVEANYCINLAKLNGKGEKLITNEIIYSNKTDEVNFDPYIAICNTVGEEGDLCFEDLAYICNLFSRYSTFLDEV